LPEALPDDTDSTTEYSRDAILAAMAKLGAPPGAPTAVPDLPEGATTQFSRDAIRQALGLPQTPAPQPPSPPATDGATPVSMEDDADTPPDALGDDDHDDDEVDEDNEGREGTKFYKRPVAPPKKK